MFLEESVPKEVQKGLILGDVCLEEDMSRNKEFGERGSRVFTERTSKNGLS